MSTDIVLIGAGIMSATLGTLLQELDPSLRIRIYERLDRAAAESSDAWNNAGTGHSGFCELNYTPQRPDGTVETQKAETVAEAFEISRQFWASLVREGAISPSFIRSVPHCAFVWGNDDVQFLRARFAAMKKRPLFEQMEYAEDRATLDQWMPLVMEGRDPAELVAATRMPIGTDVDFGTLTRTLIARMEARGAEVFYNYEVRDLHYFRNRDMPDMAPFWQVRVKNLSEDYHENIQAPFVFIGAGGGALHLLQTADIPEGRHYGGFPVSGEWLRCKNPEIIARHGAKVYGKAAVGAPPMSVPHLDTRKIEGHNALLFGPYAGFSTKFLKSGSYTDLPASLRLSNLAPMLGAGLHNIPLTKYLIQQVVQSDAERLKTLRDYYPEAQPEDWEQVVAGQRVQVIKENEKGDGILEFGTEVISTADGSLAALLGASPGASTAASIMLNVLAKCFPQQLATPAWQEKLTSLIPSYGQKLADNPELLRRLRQETAQALELAG